MSNSDLIKKFYTAFKNKDEVTYLAMCDDKIEWITMAGMPSGGTYVGIQSVFDDYFPNMLANFAEFHASPETYLDSNDHVVVVGRYTGISKQGKRFDVPFSHVYQIEDNKITRFRQFTDTQKIQESLG